MKDGRSRLSRLDALFHSSHPGSEFWVLVLRLSVPNRVWDAMGSPLLTYLASNISSGGQADLPFETVCVYGLQPAVFETPRASGDIVSLLVQPVQLRTRSHKRTNRLSKLVTDGRDQI